MRAATKTLLLLNTGVGENLGDRAMLTNTVRQLRQKHPDWRLLVCARTPDFLVAEFHLTKVSFVVDCLSRWSFRRRPTRTSARLTRFFHATLGTAEFFLLTLVVMACRTFQIRPISHIMEAELLNSLLDADAVYFIGGGYLTDQGKLECRALLTTALLAAWLKKPIILSGQGLGPYSTFLTQYLMRQVVKKADMVGLRDAGGGIRVLSRLGAPVNRTEIVCDDALTLPPSNTLAPRPRTIGVHWRVSPHQADTSRVQFILEALLDRLSEEGWTIWLFQFHERDNYEAQIYEHWVASRRWPGARIVRDQDPRVLRAEIARCTLGIGMAYHFSVFALAAAVPVLGLWHKPYYRDKIGGLMTAFGHPEWALDDRVISPDSLYETLTKMATSDCRPALVKRGSELAALHEDWQTRVDTRLSQI